MGETGPLIHIGYHKSGTTWLQRYLFQDAASGFAWDGKRTDSPVHRLVSARPLEFRAAEAAAEFARPQAKARKRGLVPVVSLERLSGHPFSGGYDSKEIAQRLFEVFPDGRVLMVVREQKAMLLSTYKQYVKAGGAMPLPRFLDPPVYRRPRIPPFDLRHFEYHRLLACYGELFGRERVLALPYERLARDGLGMVAAIAAFAGARPAPGALEALPFAARVNTATSAPAVMLQRVVNRLFVTSDVNPMPLAPWKGAAGLRRKVAELGGRAPLAMQDRLESRLREQVARAAQGRFGESNRILGEMMGVDLAAFGYEVAA